MPTKRINFRDRKSVNSGELEKEFDSIRRQLSQLSRDMDDMKSVVGELDGVSIRKDTVSVKAGENFIKFKKPLKTTTYAFVGPYLYVDSTTHSDVTLRDQQRNGFTCYCSDAGTLHYTAME